MIEPLVAQVLLAIVGLLVLCMTTEVRKVSMMAAVPAVIFVIACIAPLLIHLYIVALRGITE